MKDSAKEIMDVSPKELPWYVKTSLLVLPIVSMIINLSVGVVFLILSIRQRTINTFYKNSLWIPDPVQENHNLTFEQLFSCFFAMIIIITRYVEVDKYYKKCSKENKASLYFGCMFVFGKLMLASLNNILPNEISMTLYLAGATLYACSQVCIYCKDFGKRRRFLQTLRFIFCIGIFSNMILFGVFMRTPGLHVFNRFGFDVVKTVSVSVIVNIVFQHVWSYHSEKIYEDYAWIVCKTRFYTETVL